MTNSPKIIPSKTTRILIYCNNNFSDNVAPIMLKRVELALNVPTFVNLWGYGYENIYELSSYTESSDPRVNWVSTRDFGLFECSGKLKGWFAAL